MRNRILLNLALLLLLVALALVTFYEPGIEPEQAPQKLSAQAPASIAQIRIQHPQAAPIILRREQQQWWLTTPLRMPADESMVNHLLNLVGETSHARYPSAEMNLTAIGLEAPILTIWLDEIEFRFGKRNPLQQHRYVQVGDQVHMITDTLTHRLSSDHLSYLSRRLTPTQEIHAIQLPEQRIVQ